MRSIETAVLVAFLSLATACGQQDERGTQDPSAGEGAAVELPAAVQAQLDSGTAAFRADRIELARTHYRRATELGPDIAAGWFGVYLAEKALGNEAAADSARLEAHRRAPAAALEHPEDSMPPGHPQELPSPH